MSGYVCEIKTNSCVRSGLESDENSGRKRCFIYLSGGLIRVVASRFEGGYGAASSEGRLKLYFLPIRTKYIFIRKLNQGRGGIEIPSLDSCKLARRKIEPGALLTAPIPKRSYRNVENESNQLTRTNILS